MGNERLRAAMDRAAATIESLARAAEVDPKTVQRWLAGRAPHPRHRWSVAQYLDETEEFLWPGAVRRNHDPYGAVSELVAAYPYRSDADSSRWWTLFTGASQQIDLLGYTLYFLPQQHPQLVDLLKTKAANRCRVRLVVADPASEFVARREAEENEPITLTARIRSTQKAFQTLVDLPGVEMRQQDAPLYNSVFRFDDEMFVTPHLYATPGHAAPMLHLRRLGPAGLFSRFSAHFEGVWADSAPGPHSGDRLARAGV